MTHVVYNKDTTRLLNQIRYATRAAAKAALTRAAKADNTLIKAEYAITETNEFYNNIEKIVTRQSMMGSKDFQERVNTPFACSPRSETYWCS